MTSENCIGLSVVSGFFIGLVFAFIAFDDPEFIILFALIITTIFYLIVITSVALFNYCMGFDNKRFDKQCLEESLEYYVHQFAQKEEEFSKILNYIGCHEKEEMKQWEKRISS